MNTTQPRGISNCQNSESGGAEETEGSNPSLSSPSDPVIPGTCAQPLNGGSARSATDGSQGGAQGAPEHGPADQAAILRHIQTQGQCGHLPPGATGDCFPCWRAKEAASAAAVDAEIRARGLGPMFGLPDRGDATCSEADRETEVAPSSAQPGAAAEEAPRPERPGDLAGRTHLFGEGAATLCGQPLNSGGGHLATSFAPAADCVQCLGIAAQKEDPEAAADDPWERDPITAILRAGLDDSTVVRCLRALNDFERAADRLGRSADHAVGVAALQYRTEELLCEMFRALRERTGVVAAVPFAGTAVRR